MIQLIFKDIALTLIVLGINSSTIAQSKGSSKVYHTLKAYDSLIFERSFNHCELQYLDQLISKDFEFNYDIIGITNSLQNNEKVYGAV